MRYLLFCYILFGLLICGCGRDCIDATYTFSMTSKIKPDNDSVKVGDTLWLEVEAPVSQKDEESNNIIKYSQAKNMAIALQLQSFHGGSVSDPGSSYVLDSFAYDLVSGKLYTSDSRANNYLLDEVDNNYTLKIGIIPKRAGTFGMFISDAINVYRKNDKCIKANYYLTILDTDQHLSIYQSSRPDYVINSYEGSHGYFFKVL